MRKRRSSIWDPDFFHEVIKFPGGEWHVKGKSFGRGDHYRVVVRSASADDLFALAVVADAVHRDGGSVSAVIPYFPGARQDRRQPGEALSAKVYANFVNNLGLDEVLIMDPHSPVITALLDNVRVIPHATTAACAMRGVDVLIAPDAGAVKRTEEVAALLDVPVIQATKKRDMSTGRLSGFEVAIPDKHVVYGIVDDICDGGGTFLGLAEATGLPRENLRLFVTHGIFSGQAVTNLPERYLEIRTTDSIDRQKLPDAFRVLHIDWPEGKGL